MARQCQCAGGCRGSQTDGVNRRDFLALIGVGAATTAIGSQAWADFLQSHASPEELARWKKALMQATSPTVYRSGVHTDARMHLGGIGTGNIEIGSDGQFTRWQLFNTLADGHVPLMFAVKAGDTARLLQTTGGPDWPRVKQIEMIGEYPIAKLRYDDVDLPVKVELSAFTPFAPLDSRFSSMPLAALVFKVTNPTAQKQTVSLAAFMQNPVGYDALGAPIKGVAHEKLGGNVNEPLDDGKAAGLLMRAVPGQDPSLDKPVNVRTSPNLDRLTQMGGERPAALAVSVLQDDKIPIDRSAQNVLWFEEPAGDFPEATLVALKNAVKSGATLVFSGRTMPLVALYAGHSDEKSSTRPDTVFEDFEKGYERWKVEGDAFGTKPAAGTLANQNPVTGFMGNGLVNSFVGGDNTTGKLVSQPFTVERNFIRFLIGGGSHPNAQIRLIVDGNIVRASTGRNDERLQLEPWDVREFAGRKAHIEIVDEEKGDWGHINIDQIEFSDTGISASLLALLKDLMPARFSAIRTADGKQPTAPNALVFENLELLPDAKRTTLAAGFDVLTKPFGKGQVVVAAGAILDPGQVESAGARHRAYKALCELAGAKYSLPEGVPPSACGFGTLALAALADNVTGLTSFEDWNAAWEQFKTKGEFLPLRSADVEAIPPSPAGKTINGAVAATVEVPPGETVEVPFLLAWHYPNKYTPRPDYNYGTPVTQVGCYYTTLWPDAKAVIHEAATNFSTLQKRTEAFRKTFYDTTLPYWLLDCITSQAASMRHIGILFQLANGEPYGWEGSNGCCQPTCTHVWGYEQSLARLFPDIERKMRQIDFKYQQTPDGGINNRTVWPSPHRPSGEHPAVDGHASCILKAYREALNHPDDSFLKEYWPNVKLAVEYLIARDADGGEPDGVLEGAQFNTYDQSIHGVTTFISGYYLAALRAGEEWAKRMGDTKTAERFHAIFLKGQDNLVKRCWNGEYFQQDLPGYGDKKYEVMGMNVGEVGTGCMADQLIGQWWAHQLGLGYILPKDKVRAALRAVFKSNWLTDVAGFRQTPRAFAGDGDKGLLIVTWPKGGRPEHVMLYSDEIWTGIEYQVAGHMIYEGMIEDAYALVKGARDRYNGIPRAPIGRNPWNELECGGHYARAMSNWSLLTAAAGYEYDSLTKKLRFIPRINPTNFKTFFVASEGWGSLQQTQEDSRQTIEIQVVEGRFEVREMQTTLPPGGASRATVIFRDRNNAETTLAASLKPQDDSILVEFAAPVVIKAGEELRVGFSKSA